ncbi:HesA/MoeB/ThiF family protein [Patulibacter defluvii]|uniref:HesA/MoeB/ThiF family protein n=1 Tax=Patulibacter defluvii TaxID=3095358 RepID=UPI002A7608AB|nr:ThiF family adenylyltransferase [Patulibacter sp. DM4]
MSDGDPEPGGRLTADPDARDGRYHRQALISWWEQERLAAATVLVVGAGALGNELVKSCVLMGVGTVAVVDGDVVEDSNLSRCVLFRGEDEGRPKATVAARAAAALNPDVTVVGIVGDVRSTVGLGIVRDVDLVLGGVDNREARMHVNQACWKSGTPYVDGAIEGLQGVVRAFVAPDGPCYECTMNERDHQLVAARRSCALLTRDELLTGKVPTTATTAAVVAGIQVQEAIKLLHGMPADATLAGRGFAFNGLTHDSYVVGYPRREQCLAHDRYDPRRTSAVPATASFAALLAAGRERLGHDEVELETEVELVLGADCGACGAALAIARPLHELGPDDVRCRACGSETTPRLRHRIGPADGPLLERRPADVGLPPGDTITARHGLERWHLTLDGDRPLGERLRTAAAA